MTSYREAGVDQDAADALVPVFRALAERTRRPEVLEAVGGFAGLVSIGGGRALAVSTDGVGTKVELLRRAGLHHTAGWDAVAMNVDDVVCVGAEPLLLVDYVSVERLDPGVVEEVVRGVADACARAGCALVGGEVSQHPGLLPPGGYDVVATCVGVVETERVWGPHRVRPGDAVVGLASSGPHANGFSLVRKLLGEEEPPPEVLAPTAIYAPVLLSVAEGVELHAAAHVTGGGITGNLARVLPPGLGATVERGSWPVPGVFSWIEARGVPAGEMWRTFNMGLGMLVLTPDGEGAVSGLQEAGVGAWVVGEVTGEPGVRLR